MGDADETLGPVLAIKRGLSFNVAVSLEELSSCTAQAYDEGYYNDLLLYDTSGGLWPIVEATPVEGPTLLDELLPWRRIHVELSLGPRKQAEVGEVAEWLRAILATSDGFDYVDGPASEEIERKLLDAKTPFEIIQVASLVG